MWRVVAGTTGESECIGDFEGAATLLEGRAAQEGADGNVADGECAAFQRIETAAATIVGLEDGEGRNAVGAATLNEGATLERFGGKDSEFASEKSVSLGIEAKGAGLHGAAVLIEETLRNKRANAQGEMFDFEKAVGEMVFRTI